MAAAEPEPRLPLTRDRILGAALELADDGGIDSLTMRKLGQELGFEAMSLYHYVANKNELLNGLCDLVLAETDLPSPDGDWVEAVRSSAISVHRALHRHPWACTLLMAPDHVRPARLRYMDSLLGCLRDAGFSAETTYHAYHVIDGHIFGFSFWQSSHAYTAEELSQFVETFAKAIPADEYPHLHEHGAQHFAEGPHHDVSAFEFGLDLILEGLQKIHRAESES